MHPSFINSLIATLGTGLLFSVVTAQENTNGTSSNPQVQLTSANDFCLFLPPEPGLTVAINEDNGIPFCLNPSTVPGSKPFPQGFITTAHYYKSNEYTQITGFFDRTQYSMNATDEGGQYDSHANHKPTGASCQNFPFFVSLIEPSNNRFCIRCCQNTEDCKTGISQRGCARVISPGNYNDNNAFDDVPPSDPTADAGTGNGTTGGTGNGTTDGTGNGTTDGTGNGTTDGTGNGTTDGTGNGTTDGTGNGTTDGTGNGTTDGTGNGTTNGPDDDTNNGPDDDTNNGPDDDTNNGPDDGTNDTSTNSGEQKVPNTSYNSVLDDVKTTTEPNSMAEEGKYIQEQLQSDDVDLEALKTHFRENAQKLAQEYPDAADKISTLISITSKYTTSAQWEHLASVLTQNDDH